jgi:hypothetical protein
MGKADSLLDMGWARHGHFGCGAGVGLSWFWPVCAWARLGQVRLGKDWSGNELRMCCACFVLWKSWEMQIWSLADYCTDTGSAGHVLGSPCVWLGIW